MNASWPLEFLPVYQVSAEIEAGNLTCREYTESLLQRIEQFDEKLHAFTAVYGDSARKAAAAADQAIQTGHRIGPCHGLPVAVKDIVDVRGQITMGGSKMWANRVSPVTATLVNHMVRAGLVILGKTHSVEFAMGSFGTNQHLGTPWNPWNTEKHHIPGGSSAGSGVSVAAGLAPWAIGTDTGGSVRLPASFCGIVGLKTTVGQVSCDGVLPLSTTLDTPGPMCRAVEDAALLYEILKGCSVPDSARHSCQQRHLRQGVAGLKLAQMPPSERLESSPEVLAAYDRSLNLLADLGAVIVDIELPQGFQELGTMVGQIIGVEGYSFVGEYVDDPNLPLDDDVRPRIQLGRDVLAHQYFKLLRNQQKAKQLFHQAIEGVAALITPTTGTTAPLVAAVDQSSSAAFYTRPVNLVEACALAIPNGLTDAGLPTSLQIICPGHGEQTALRIGWALEQASERQIPPAW